MGVIVQYTVRHKEIAEFEAIEREEAIKKIAALVDRFAVGPNEIFAELSTAYESPINQKPATARSFDPFLDAW